MKEAFQNCVYMGKGVTVDETVGINGSVLLEDDVSIAKNFADRSLCCPQKRCNGGREFNSRKCRHI